MSESKEPDYGQEYNRGEGRAILNGCLLGFAIPIGVWIALDLIGLVIFLVGYWIGKAFGWPIFQGTYDPLLVLLWALWAAPPISAVISLFLTIRVKRKSPAMGRVYLTVVAILTVILLGGFASCALPGLWR